MYGFKAENGVIKDVGRVPITVRDIAGTVTFAKGAGMAMTVLDANGRAKGAALPVTGGAVQLAKDALYIVVTR
jgi:hypothetical protein